MNGEVECSVCHAKVAARAGVAVEFRGRRGRVPPAFQQPSRRVPVPRIGTTFPGTWIAASTRDPGLFMGSSPDRMQFFSILLKMIGAKNPIEVGVFTGYSLLSTALALPADGKVVAIDMDREYYELGRPGIEKAGVEHKVDFREGDGLAVLDGILGEDGGVRAGTFDFAYADADKLQYGGYHERLLRLVRVGGTIAYDNTLWGGSVAMPRDTPGSSEYDRVVRDRFLEFNAAVAADDRVEACVLPVADGVTLCRRVK